MAQRRLEFQTLWDVHELGYLIWALLEEHQHFGQAPSLVAARQAADRTRGRSLATV